MEDILFLPPAPPHHERTTCIDCLFLKEAMAM